jgi:hypothetical protein
MMRRLLATTFFAQEGTMSKELHDLEADVLRTIAGYVDEQREVIELMSGTESVAQRVTDSIDEAIAAIQSPVGPSISDATTRFRGLPADFVEPALESFAARAFGALLPDMVQLEKRLDAVMQLAIDAAPSQRASATLSKIVRSYLLGLDAETIAMCRAAIDVSVSDIVEPLALEPSARGAKIVSMKDKLEFLVSRGRLSEASRKDAIEVWRQGNEVLHNNINDIKSAPKVVGKTLNVIAALFPLDPPH